MSTTTPKRKLDAYQIITQKFIDAIESGTNPFVQPWSSGDAGGLPRNISKRCYRGINLLITLYTCQEMEWSIPIFLTYKQAKEQEWIVRKGEKATHVCFAGVKVPDAYKDNPDQCPADERRYYRKLYAVFNISQLDGVDMKEFLPKEREFSVIESAQQVVSDFIDCPPIEHSGTEAFYVPKSDSITMPPQNTFESNEAYYEVLFHEMSHATGHESRLNRDKGEGQKAYAFEELVAELSSSFLCAHTGIQEAGFERSAAYLSSWLEILKEDKTFLFQAASKAQLATDYILGTKIN